MFDAWRRKEFRDKYVDNEYVKKFFMLLKDNKATEKDKEEFKNYIIEGAVKYINDNEEVKNLLKNNKVEVDVEFVKYLVEERNLIYEENPSDGESITVNEFFESLFNAKK